MRLSHRPVTRPRAVRRRALAGYDYVQVTVSPMRLAIKCHETQTVSHAFGGPPAHSVALAFVAAEHMPGAVPHEGFIASL